MQFSHRKSRLFQIVREAGHESESASGAAATTSKIQIRDGVRCRGQGVGGANQQRRCGSAVRVPKAQPEDATAQTG